MPRYFLFIEFLGTSFSGWQKQPGFVTVQGELERCIQLITKKEVLVYGSGRTDVGVHASHQVAHVDLDRAIDTRKFSYSLNSLLPKSAQVWAIREVTETAHARFDATSRAYAYHLITRPSPLREATMWFMNAELNFELMQEAARLIPSVTNFQPFSKDNPGNIGSEFCNVIRSEWEKRSDHELVFHIESDRFLHHMVRYLVGSMFKVGNGVMSLDRFEMALKGEIADFVHFKAPAHGLTLNLVRYPETCFLDS